MGKDEPREGPFGLLPAIGLGQQIIVEGYEDPPELRGTIHQRRVIQFCGPILRRSHNVNTPQAQV